MCHVAGNGTFTAAKRKIHVKDIKRDVGLIFLT